MGPGRRIATIDCGNSTITCRRFDDGAVWASGIADFAPPALTAFLRDGGVEHCIVASVVDAVLALVESAILAAGAAARVAGRDLRCPLPLDYATPATLGVDRWLGALAAHARCGRAIAIDCGSATTVNLVEADGTFRGGAIAPGLAAFARGMAAVTPALPAARLDAVARLPGESSAASVDAGVLVGYAGMIERLVAELIRAARGPLRVVVTGGNAPRFLRHTRLQIEHLPHLVHEGLLLLAGVRPCGS